MRDSANSFLRAGYSANADIILDKRDKVLAVPESVLMFDKDRTYVEVKTGENSFEKKYITTGISDGVNIEVTGGLTKNDKIKIPLITEPESK